MYNSDKTAAVTFIVFYKKKKISPASIGNYLSFTVQNPPPCLPTYPSAFTAYIIWRQLPPTLYLAYLYSYALANLLDQKWMSTQLNYSQ